MIKRQNLLFDYILYNSLVITHLKNNYDKYNNIINVPIYYELQNVLKLVIF